MINLIDVINFFFKTAGIIGYCYLILFSGMTLFCYYSFYVEAKKKARDILLSKMKVPILFISGYIFLCILGLLVCCSTNDYLVTDFSVCWLMVLFIIREISVNKLKKISRKENSKTRGGANS